MLHNGVKMCVFIDLYLTSMYTGKWGKLILPCVSHNEYEWHYNTTGSIDKPKPLYNCFIVAWVLIMMVKETAVKPKICT